VLIDAFVDHLGRVGPAVLFRREHLHQLAAAVDQRFERLGLRVWQRTHLGFDRGAKAHQHLCVQRVGLGQLPGGACEVAHLAWVNHGHPDARRRQGTGDRDFQTAGRFDNHQVSGFKSLKQRTDAALVVGHRKALAVGPQRHVQLCLGHVDPDIPFCLRHHRTSSRCLPSLAIRDFLPLQPFGLERREGAATFAARRGSCPKAAPACRAMSFDSSTTFATYKDVDERVESRDWLGLMRVGSEY